MGGKARWLWLLLAGLGVGGLIIALSGRFPGALDDSNNVTRLIYLLMWLVLAAGGLVPLFVGRPLKALRDAAIWAGLILALLIAYSYRDGLGGLGQRLTAELVPRAGMVAGDGSISFRAGSDGHFHVEAVVDGTRLDFLVDTGASDIVLSPADARRLGFDPARLDYRLVFETANGRVRGAPVRLREIVIGPIKVVDIGASVNQAHMSGSLLGMSLLGRLGGYQVTGDTLTLRQ
ncbi:MAG: retropepsin-like aspartic protease family protein [Dongiaceae bacterium]